MVLVCYQVEVIKQVRQPHLFGDTFPTTSPRNVLSCDIDKYDTCVKSYHNIGGEGTHAVYNSIVV